MIVLDRAASRRPRAPTNRKKPVPARPRPKGRPRSGFQLKWAQAIPNEHWACYRTAIQALRRLGTRFLLGGGFALATHIGRWRNTKDIDFYILPHDREAAVDALTRAGFVDYYSRLPYDRNWIYRSTCAGVIVDLIWAMANQRAQVDESWMQDAPEVEIRGEALMVIPMEEFIWCKLYILQRDHCDWTDVWNLLYAAGEEVDWRRLLRRLDEDWPLLKALLTMYCWLCPERADRLPQWLQNRFHLQSPAIPAHPRRNRVRLLDSRAWFSALLPNDKPLDV